jgi:hypothetical protein
MRSLYPQVSKNTTTFTLYPKAPGFMPAVHNSIPFHSTPRLPAAESLHAVARTRRLALK